MFNTCTNNSISSFKYTEEDIFKMLEFFSDNIFVQCGGRIFKQTVDISIGKIDLHYLLT